MTKLQLFKRKWCEGCGAIDCDNAHKVALFRGTVPCDVLFAGEAPGLSEDTIGKPFIGPAGRLMDHIIERTQEEVEYKYALTNVVGCLPIDVDEDGKPDKGKKLSEPSQTQLDQCKPRLEEFIALCKPKLIVCVGKIAWDWLQQGYLHSVKLPTTKPALVEIRHPSYILRSPYAGQSLLIDEAVCTIEDEVAKVMMTRDEKKVRLKNIYSKAEKRSKK